MSIFLINQYCQSIHRNTQPKPLKGEDRILICFYLFALSIYIYVSHYILHGICTFLFRKSNATVSIIDTKDTVASKMESNDLKIVSNTSSAPLVQSKKPNYDWLRPPKPPLINDNSQKQSTPALDSSKESNNITPTSTVVNKALSTISSSSSSSSSPDNRYFRNF